MTRSEYQELVEFIGPKFDRIERRFDGVEARLTRVEVAVEENRHLIQVVAESVTSLREEMARGFSAQAKRIDDLDARVGRWEGRSA